MQQALLLVLLCESDRAGNRVADVDGSEIVKVHLRREKANHAADMGDHAAGKQARDNAAPEPTALHECLIDVVRVVVTCYSAEEGNVPVSKRASKGEGLPYVYRIKGGS